MKPIVFVVDDEKAIQEILEVNLQMEGYDVYTFSSVADVEVFLENKIPDLILLDVMMEEVNGFDFCKSLKFDSAYQDIAIIFISAKDQEFDKVLGLELGGDDYITKPFSLQEVKSRVKAVLRRTKVFPQQEGAQRKKDKDPNKIKYKELTINKNNYSLSIKEKKIRLTKTEFNILFLFLSNPDKIFSRDNIIDSVKGDDVYVVDRTIDVHIMNLRKKIDGEYKNIISTFSGVGYGFREV